MMPAPYVNAEEAVVINAIWAVSPVLAPVGGLTDEDGSPLSVGIRSVYSDEPLALPEIVVSTELGRTLATGGGSAVSTDPTTFATNYAEYLPDSRILFTVMARSDAERHYLIDVLREGIRTAYAVLPSGQRLEQVIMANLAEKNIFYTGLGAPQYPAINTDEARPEGQVWRAVLTVQCQVWMSWSSPPNAGFPTVHVAQTGVLPSGATETDPTLTP